MQPFVKWAGGKRQYIKTIMEMAPTNFNTYYEPFVGGGAVLFSLSNSNSKINDINTHLIHSYHVIRDNPNKLMEYLDDYDSIPLNEEKYKEMREIYNQHIIEKRYDITTAALFIYLNKHAFNGLFRVNKKGLFNVPWNKKEFVASYNKSNIIEISNFLQTVTITSTDFEEAVSEAEEKDFVFFDSPYAPLNATSFISYDKAGFSIEEHKRLAKLYKSLTEKNVKCMLTNHNTELIRELYNDFNVKEINVRRSINSDASKRVGKEVIITNY
ncbi:Dam family site-specific DNA-(adenine-N6)-methyltransferase [Staphylococcus taiwanensis]|nr:Dam family site-specific DNA-(adenine-N6)-methyltransferase [Staphylococcus taiwanensis]